MATLYAVESEQSWSDTWYEQATGGNISTTLFTGGAANNQNSGFDDIGIGGSVNLGSNGEFTFAEPGESWRHDLGFGRIERRLDMLDKD